jgi:hypothetical protein
VNGMDRHLRDLLEAAVGEPPRRVTVEAVRRRVIRRRVVEYAAAAVAVAAIAVIISVSVGALGHALGRGPGPVKPGPAPSRPRFTSREYGYTEALPRGWRSGGPARQRWNGKGSPAYTDPTVDLFFMGPGGVEAWVYAAPTRESLTAYTAATIRATRAGHPCSAPQSRQAITIGGAPARLLDMQCPAHSGFLVEIAVTIRRGTAFVFASQNPSGNAPADQRPDRVAFRKFLAGIRLQR